MTISFETFVARGKALPERARAAVVAQLDGEETIEPMGVAGDRIHFLAHHRQTNAAQSGSDWMDHAIRAGTAALDGSGLELRTIYSAMIIEYDFRTYRPARIAETERDKWLVELGVEPPKPEMRNVTVVRCPQCGATDAGAVEHCIERVRMSCGACGFIEWTGDDEIKDDWNIEIEIRKDDELPAFVPPLPPKLPGGFELRDGRLVHPRVGYAITIPGEPWGVSVRHTDSALFRGVYVWFDVTVRVEGFYFEGAADALVRREIEDVAKRRAIAGTALEIVAEPGYLRTKYPRPVTDDPEETEVLFAMIKPAAVEHYFSIVFVTIRYAHFKNGHDEIDALCNELIASQRF